MKKLYIHGVYKRHTVLSKSLRVKRITLGGVAVMMSVVLAMAGCPDTIEGNGFAKEPAIENGSITDGGVTVTFTPNTFGVLYWAVYEEGKMPDSAESLIADIEGANSTGGNAVKGGIEKIVVLNNEIPIEITGLQANTEYTFYSAVHTATLIDAINNRLGELQEVTDGLSFTTQSDSQ